MKGNILITLLVVSIAYFILVFIGLSTISTVLCIIIGFLAGKLLANIKTIIVKPVLL